MIRALLFCAALIAFANVPARSAMPPHGPYANGCHPDDVRAVAQQGITIAFDCFDSSTGMNSEYGVRMRFSPDEERYSTGGATTSSMQVFVSADPACPTPHDGSIYSLSGPCVLIMGQTLPDTGESYVNSCNGRWQSPMVGPFVTLHCVAGPPKYTSGSITFTRWATKPGGRLEFKFSPNAQLTEFLGDTNAPSGYRQAPMRISGTAIVRLL